MQSVSLDPRRLQRYTARAQRFLQRQPLLAKALPTAVGFAFGDFLTQHFNRPKHGAYAYSVSRTAKMALLGAVIAGPVGLAFLRALEPVVLPHAPASAAALGIKFTLDQALGCVLWQACQLAVSSCGQR